MESQPSAADHEERAIEVVGERIDEHQPGTISRHTLIVTADRNRRSRVFDRVEETARATARNQAVVCGRIRDRSGTKGAAELWDQLATAAELNGGSTGRPSGMARIEKHAVSDPRLMVFVVDDLENTITKWKDQGDVLQIRWVLQNVGNLMLIGGMEKPREEPSYEQSILWPQFSGQYLDA